MKTRELSRLPTEPFLRLYFLVLRHKTLAYLCLGFLIALVPIVVNAQSAGSSGASQIDALQSLIKQNQDVQAFWDDLWQKSFNPSANSGIPNLADYMFNNVCKFFIYIGLIFWIWKFGLSMVGQIFGGGAFVLTFVQAFLPLVLTAILLVNNAQPIRTLGLGVRTYINNQKSGILNAQISTVTFRQAMSDIFITQSAANQIAQQLQACQQLNQPNIALPSPTRPTDPAVLSTLSPQQLQAYDFLDCQQKALDFANQQLQTGQSQQCTSTILQSPCVLFSNYMNRTISTIDSAINQFKQSITNSGTLPGIGSTNPFLDIVGGLVTSASQKTLLTTIQYWAVSFMELALFLDALIAPLAISLAIIPARLNMTAGWIISFMTILVAQLANVVVVGFSSIQLAQSSSFSLSDTRFEMAIGIIAPLVSLAIVGGGGFFAARTFMGTSLAGVSAVAGVVSSGASAVVMGVSRAIDKAR
jgi:hypothetical protein